MSDLDAAQITLVLPAVLAAVAAWLLVGAGPPHLVARRLGTGAANWRPRITGRGRLTSGAAAVVSAGVVFAALGPGRLLVAVTAAGVSAAAVRMRVSVRRRLDAERTRGEVVEICDALAAEMRAGQPAPRALHRTAEHYAELSAPARAADMSGDVPAALRAVAANPGAGGLLLVAAAWQVAERSGAGLALTLDRIAAALRSEHAAACEVEASLGPPRATARLLAMLPLLGLLLGMGVGGDPVAVLLSSTLGNVCLALGSALALLGVWWVERLAAGVRL
ncbi:MAG TPA: type II secretion system protein [Nocardioidaceae bacterium]|nr:type II secretion system protein [Actinomycetota bacterium]HEV8056759.1 type II secretion system protein [Nocardioidaceae bacterium]